ncbi:MULTISPECIES: cytochrome P450 family protein [Actinoalloteichus]|uniref:Cytochrome P450 n=1 Tax=Actinoalloteichus fjordicus TaxID=1612552 RepID=A0AAC9LDV4_9PSEU|nr:MULTISPECIES: cytochrome P450 [Actinoalloteichus]APU15536.1 cytochrome P450 [Actinoalloteichus fjordicus]APU21603.1 cytochrome P450 [Actinoalloteichus sp. GBA129-24]
MSEYDDAVRLPVSAFADPEKLFAMLGDRGPVHRVTLPDGMPTVLVTGNDAARAALADSRLVRGIDAAAPELHRYHPMGGADFPLSAHMLFADPPNHGRLRRLVSKAFTRRRVEEMRPRVQQITDALIDAVAADGSADLVTALALPLPITVICEMLGIPVGDRAEFEEHAEVLTGINTSSGYDEIIAAGRWLDVYLTALVSTRRRAPGADLVSAMLLAQEEDDRLTDAEVRSNAMLLLSAGFETTVNLIANGLLTLLRHPESTAMLRADPTMMPGAVEELLRFDSPVSSVTYHFAREPLEIAGVEIRPGEHVVISAAAANHDPEVFEEPGRLDLRREVGGRILGFSHGIHYCLGAPLARMEGEIAFATVLRRLDDLRLAVPPTELAWKPSYNLHRLTALPVEFTPVTAARPAPAGPNRRAD